VLVNLVQNVLRHAYPGAMSDPRVDVRLSDAGESYTLEFEDYGAGVAPEISPRMFEPFVTSSRASGGTGLGLAISHNIMTNILKGKISFTTAAGRGTKFVLSVPKSVPAE
jgi:C4-dicarboxylate-specific signal transduction histidine kinase